MTGCHPHDAQRAGAVSRALGLSTTVAIPAAIDGLENAVLPHPHFEDVARAIANLHARSGRRLRPRALLFTGESGAGKTTILNLYASMYPHVTLEDLEAGSPAAASLTCAQREGLREADLRRVVSVELHKSVTQRSLSADLLVALGYDAPRSMNAAEVVDRIAFHVRALGTELILLDEAHYVVRDGNDDVTSDNAEFLKSMLNKVAAQIVLVGLPKLLHLRRHRQLWRRLEPDVALRPYDWHTVEGRVEFSSLLTSFEGLLGLPEASGLGSHALAKRIYVATGGELGIVAKYLSEGLKEAMARNAPRLTTTLLAAVHDRFRQQPLTASATILDFDQVVDEATLETLRRQRGEANPFTCDDGRLRDIYLDTIAPTQVRVEGRRTGARAKGTRPYTPVSNRR